MCTINANEIKTDGAAVAGALLSISGVLATEGDTALAAQLSTAATALKAITDNWTTGSPVADFNEAASIVEDVLGQVPQTSVIVPFVEIAVTALDILIANIGSSPAAGQPAAGITPASVKEMQAKIATFPLNPYRGKQAIHRGHFEAPRDAFKKAWNAEADKVPQAGVAKI